MSAPAPSSTTTSSSLFSSVITPKIISGNRSQKKVNNKHGSDKTTIQAKTFTMMPSVTSRLKKNISRTKEKILQGIGKTDRTADESFDLYVENFDRQHTQAAKLTKELNRLVCPFFIMLFYTKLKMIKRLFYSYQVSTSH